MGKVSLTYEGLHRFCFTCKLISHDENTCPQLSPAERELKIKQRAGNHLTNDQTRPHLQDSQAFNSRNTLKRPRFPINGRHSSPLTSSRNNESLQEEKRRKSTPSAHSPREARNLGYQARDLRSSSRQDHNSHQGREVWSRLEIPTRREESRGRTNDRHHSRNLFPYPAPRPRNSSSMEWRPIRNNEDQRNRTSDNRALRHTTINRSERSRATFDSQRTISENRASLESGEIPVSKNRGDATIDATIDAETEEERIRRIKGKAIATDTPARTSSMAQRNAALTITEKPSEPSQQRSRPDQRYQLPSLDHNDKSLELGEHLDQDVDAPLTELENAEVDNLVLETERLEMEENMADIDNMIDIDNDDLLGDSPELDAEKIEFISQLSPATAVPMEADPPNTHPGANMAAIPDKPPALKSKTHPAPYVPKVLLKKKAP
ncbi:unnamed protein product [Brassica oleracea]